MSGDLPERVLSYLDQTGGLVDSLQLSKELEEDHQKIVGAIKSLQSIGGLIDVEQKTSARWELTEEGTEGNILGKAGWYINQI